MTELNQSILDLEELVDRIGGDKEFAQELLQEFREGLDRELLELKETLESGDLTAITERSHALKGSALNLSAKSFASVAKEIEHSSRDGNVESAASVFPSLLSEAEKLKQAIDHLR